jgi:DNA-binding MarR family transcriptional regulator
MPRRDRPSADGLVAWRGFLRAHQAVVAELDRELVAAHALPLAWYDVLVQLSEAGGEATMGEVSGRLLISPSTCTRVVEKLVNAGFVARRIDDVDARVRHVSLTPAGRSTLRSAAVTHLAGIERHFTALLAAADGVDGVEPAMLTRLFDAMVSSTER